MAPTPERVRALSAARTYLERGFRFEQAGTAERALEAYREALGADATTHEQVEARIRLARVHRTLADWDACRDESAEAIRLAESLNADDLVAEAMNVEVGALQLRGSFEEADHLGLEAVARAKSPRVRGITLQNLGRSAAERGDFDTADRYFDESISAFREENYELGLSVALCNAARAALDRGDVARSIEIGQEGIVLARRLNALGTLLILVQNQAAALVKTGNLESAESLLTEALGHFTSARNVQRQAECLEIMGQISELRNDFDTSIRCFRRALDLAKTAADVPLVERLTARIASREDRDRDDTHVP